MTTERYGVASNSFYSVNKANMGVFNEKIIRFIGSLFCIVSLVALCLATWTLLEVQELATKCEKDIYLQTGVGTDNFPEDFNAEDDDPEDEFQNGKRERRQAQNCSPDMCKNKQQRRKCKKYCKRRRQTMKKNKNGSNQRFQIGTQQSSPRWVAFPASHYVSNKRFSDKIKYKGTATLDFANQTLQVYEAASWVTEATSPFLLQNNGVFQVKENGIHFVYAQITFAGEDKDTMAGAELVLKRNGDINQHLTCFHNILSKRSMKSCTIVGLLSAEKMDVLELYNLFKSVNIELQPRLTYFGGIRLGTMV